MSEEDYYSIIICAVTVLTIIVLILLSGCTYDSKKFGDISHTKISWFTEKSVDSLYVKDCGEECKEIRIEGAKTEQEQNLKAIAEGIAAGIMASSLKNLQPEPEPEI